MSIPLSLEDRLNNKLGSWGKTMRAAAGAVEAAICALTIYYNKVPINANLTRHDPECNLNFVLNKAKDLVVRVAMSNSLGFGGSNSCLVFRDPEAS